MFFHINIFQCIIRNSETVPTFERIGETFEGGPLCRPQG